MRIVFYGLVQGVGFRPAVYRVAKSLGLKGYIRNNGSNVEVVVDKDHNKLIDKLKSELPPLANITRIELDDSPRDSEYEDFSIVFSEDGERSSVIPTDTAICDDCLSELFNEKDRRYLYPFINCTNCGARFSAIESVPYDRVNTSMKDFELCEKCQGEYDIPSDRRFYAQTISCKDDGPHFTLYSKDKEVMDHENPIEYFAEQIDSGAIGVLKSWGGMHLICNLEILPRFREWYFRPEKPFAVMARNIHAARELADISSFEEKLLTSLQRPIVIVQKREDRRDDPLLDYVSPKLDNIGLYLPYSSIQHLLFRHLKNDEIIMTSANPPGEPIVTDNDIVFSLSADIYMLHNRNIINRIDDSVMIPFENRTFFIRKSRGFVPLELNPNHNKQVIAVGPEENLTTSVSTQGCMYTSQYIGDVRKYNVYEFQRSATYHLMNLFGITEIDAVGADLHPLYTSRRFAKELDERYNAEVFEVQHHWAHAVSLMVDNNLKDEIVCLTLDGAGYGTDNKAVSDPRRLVFAISEEIGVKSSYFDDETASVLKKAMNNSPKSCSFGRFLDAISCYLDVCCKKTYDGEPAIKLERYLNRGNRKYDFEVKTQYSDINVIDTLGLFRQLFEYNLKEDQTPQKMYDLAYSMVYSALESMVEIAVNCAKERNISKIGITGGVAYNLPIVGIVKNAVEKRNLTLVTHNQVPCGDGGISVGQNAIAGNLLKE
jgi:hydrogenase maturation protein HypF